MVHDGIKDYSFLNQGPRKSKKVRVRKIIFVENSPFPLLHLRRKNHRHKVCDTSSAKGQSLIYVPSILESNDLIVNSNNVVSKSLEVQFSGGSLLCCNSFAESDVVMCNT